MKKTRKPGGGRKKLKPEYDAGKNLKEQMDAAVALYDSEMSLQAIGDALNLNPIKVRKLLITAGVYVIVEIYNHMDDSDKDAFTLEDAEDMVADQIRMDKEAGREPLAYDPQFFYDTIVDLMEQDAEDAE